MGPDRRIPRASGVLTHVTSLPGAYRIGDIGHAATRFLSFLKMAGQMYWQLLPTAPVVAPGQSPYSGRSAFAGNPLLIGLEPLAACGLLVKSEIDELVSSCRDRVDYPVVEVLKEQLLTRAYERFLHGAASELELEFAAFCRRESTWLDTFTIFEALSGRHGRNWTLWPPRLRDRDSIALQSARQDLAASCERLAFSQFLFFRQWAEMRALAGRLGIRLVGDLPIFLASHSADVWTHRELFKVSPAGRPIVFGGVPPDYFSSQGQVWRNPVYDWQANANDGYKWWERRFRHALGMFDIIRVDHFRGFESFWEVPVQGNPGEGWWVKGPGAAPFQAVEKALGRKLPVIAEDLGTITEQVTGIRRELGYPGMKVMQMELENSGRDPVQPITFSDPHTVAYTGTHDLNTTNGWYRNLTFNQRARVDSRIGAASNSDVAWRCIDLVLRSNADLAILPLQDVLGLGEEARMNKPGVICGNWVWRATGDQLTPRVASRLRRLTLKTNRLVSAC